MVTGGDLSKIGRIKMGRIAGTPLEIIQLQHNWKR